MPVPYHHYRFHELVEDLRKAGLVAEADALDRRKEVFIEMKRALHASRMILQDDATATLVANYDKIRPFLRPCHQQRFDEKYKKVETDWL